MAFKIVSTLGGEYRIPPNDVAYKVLKPRHSKAKMRFCVSTTMLDLWLVFSACPEELSMDKKDEVIKKLDLEVEHIEEVEKILNR